MSERNKVHLTATVPLRDVADQLCRTKVFAGTENLAELGGFDEVEVVTVPAGAVLTEPGDELAHYWIVLCGEMRAERVEKDGSLTKVGLTVEGEGFGEAPFLTGKTKMSFLTTANRDSDLVQFSAEQFWAIMASCPSARAVVLSDMARRLQAYQAEALHREKLVSLGTMAAGLMHELNNPGAAAKRAAVQLRENLMKLQQLSLRSGTKPKTPEQLDCMKGLLEHSMSGCRFAAMSSIDQADAEEKMEEWLSAAGVENAFTIGPVLVGMGFDQRELECAQEYFPAEAFSDTLNWLGSLVSSVSLVCAIEESISRITDLVMAVKKYAYDEKSPAKELDVHDSLQSTLTILGHKLRIKQIHVEKHFDASPSTIFTRGSALSQVWTNLIDNAVDASPQGGNIEIATWTESEPGLGRLVVSIIDHGSGITDEVMPRIFEPFFTTKQQGSGTGLGLDIVHRIVKDKFAGEIDVKSLPGRTSFTVRLPLSSETAEQAKTPAASASAAH